jgi:hypothetical protein
MSTKTTVICIGFLACVATISTLGRKVDRMESRVALLEQHIEHIHEYASSTNHTSNIMRARFRDIEAAQAKAKIHE